MESPEKNAVPRGKESSGELPPPLQLMKLSERSDSSLQAVSVARRTAKTPAAEVAASLVNIDHHLVEEATVWINTKIAATLKIGAREIGEYLLNKFFRNDPALVRSRNPCKNASFRALADKCGTPELPVSKTWLNNAVGVALMIRQLPETARAFKELPPSYQETLLPLGDPARVEKVAKLVVTKELSFRELRQAVAEERSRMPKRDSRGRPPSPIVVKTLNRSLKLFMFAGGKRAFTKADVEQLNEKQRQAALESAEKIIEKLKDLVGKIREA